MARCEGGDVGSMVDGAGFRLWPVFSTAGFRRKLLETVMCGVTRQWKNGEAGDFESPERRGRPQKTAGFGGNAGSERLEELLKAEALESVSDDAEGEIKRKIAAFEELQGVVRRLQLEDNGEGEFRKEAAVDVRRLAKDNSEARETLAMLGAIPSLAGMLDSGEPDHQIAALYALLNLAIGNDRNKEAVVKAGAVHKMLKLIESSSSSSVSEAIVANFLGLSALDSNKPIIGSSGAVPFLVKTFQNPSRTATTSSQARQDALRSFFNLSISPTNTRHLIEAGLIPCLLTAIGDMEVSEKVLSILSNLVAIPEGRRAVSRRRDSIPILVDVLNWTDSPGCQEKAAYILMVMAHKGYGDRTAMTEAGIVSCLLELTLVGSALGQKRASRILEILRADKGKQVSEGFSGGGVPPVSAPLCGGPSDGREVLEEDEQEETGMSEERKAVRQLVQQSLQNNMRRIVRRANLPQDFAPSDHLKALTTSSTSKSLPF